MSRSRALSVAPDELPSRFEVEAVLGAGSFGTVYRVFDRERAARLALKVLHRAGAAALLRFKREFRSLADLHHPNLLRLYELFADGARWFFTMELVDGVPITDARRDEAAIRRAFGQLASGLGALHANGHLHRDLKPSNVMVEPSGRVVLLDFGFIGDASDASTDLVGTPAHASPEQLAGARCDEASDWYAFGSMLFEAFAGRSPFEGRRPLEIMARKPREDAPALRELAPHAPDDLCRLVDALLARDPAARPGPAQILEALETPAETVLADPPLVGRARELAALERAFERMRAERATRVLWLEGASGVGKTALLHAFAERVADDAWVLDGRCYEQESVPHKALDGVFDALTRLLVRLPRSRREALLGAGVAHASLLFPVLGRVAGLRASPAAHRADPQRQREIAVAALRRLLAALADERPLVVLVDDLQWADADSATLLEELTERGPPLPLLFVGTHRPLRPEASPFFSALTASAERLVLEPLSADAAVELTRTLLPAADDATCAALARESGGLPFLLGELTLHVRRHGSRRPRAADLLSERLEGLGGDERALLELVCVAGQPVPTGLLARAPRTPFDEARVDVLRRGRWLQVATLPEGPAVAAYHDRIAEAVRASLDEPRRRRLHGELAELLREWPEAEPEAVAVHFERAGREEGARAFTAKAAARAAKALAWDRAVRLYQRALEMASDDREARRLRIALGDALAGAGRGAEAAEVYRVACHGAESELVLELERRVADQLLRAGHFDAGYRALDAVLGSIGVSLPRSPRTAIASLLYHRARLELRGIAHRERREEDCPREALRRVDVLWSAGVGLSMVDSPRGADFLARSLLAALELGEPRRVARSLAYDACFVSNRGLPAQDEARRLLEASRAIAQRLDDDYLHALTLGAACFVEFHGARWPGAAEYAERSEAAFAAQPVGFQREVSSVRWFWAIAQTLTGRFDALEARLPDLLRTATERGDIFSAVNFRSGFPNLLWLAKDDEARARDEARDAMRRWTRRGFLVQHFCDLYARVGHELYAGDGEQALAVVRTAWRHYERSHLSRLQFIRVTCLELRGRAHLAAASARRWKRRARLREVRRCVAELRRERAAWADAFATLLEAGVRRLDDPAAAVERYAEAAAAFEREHMAVHALAARRAAAEALGRSVTRFDAQLHAHGVVAPARYARMLAPG